MFRPDDWVPLLEVSDVDVPVRRGITRRRSVRFEEPNTDGPSWFASLTQRTTVPTPCRCSPPSIRTNPGTSHETQQRDDAADTGTSRAVLPDILPATTSRPKRDQTDHDERAASPILNASITRP
jgi:hypothetical protein